MAVYMQTVCVTTCRISDMDISRRMYVNLNTCPEIVYAWPHRILVVTIMVDHILEKASPHVCLYVIMAHAHMSISM